MRPICLLIPAFLLLITGYAKTAYCQNISEGYGHGLARTSTAHPSCVYEQVPIPWGPLGLGDIHEWGDCEAPVLHYHHSGTKSPCWAWAWGVVDPTQPDMFSYTVQWGPDGTLEGLGVKATDWMCIGSWESWGMAMPEQPTWNQHKHGTPIIKTLRWAVSEDFINMPCLSFPDLVGAQDPIYLPFVAYFGVQPWRAALEIRVDWLDPIPLVEFRGSLLEGQWFGGRSRLTVSVIPDPVPTDVDRNGVSNVADIFAFLSAWFKEWHLADWDMDQVVTVPDIFAFLSDWFTE